MSKDKGVIMLNKFEFRALVEGHLELPIGQQKVELKPLIYLEDVGISNNGYVILQKFYLVRALRQQLPYLNLRARDDMMENFKKENPHDQDDIYLKAKVIWQVAKNDTV